MSHSVAVGTEPSMQGQTFVVLSPTIAARPHVAFANWKKTAATRLGIVLIVLALAAIVCNIVWLTVPNNSDWYNVTLSPSGLGFWGGILLSVTGVLCISAGRRPTHGLIIATLVMAIVSLFACFSMLIISAVQVSIPPHPIYTPTYSNANYINGTWVLAKPNDAPPPFKADFAFGLLFLLISIISIALLLTASILSCKGLCSPRSSPRYVLSAFQPNAFAYLSNPLAIHSAGYTAGHPLGIGAPPPYSASTYSDDPSATPPSEPPPSYSLLMAEQTADPQKL